MESTVADYAGVSVEEGGLDSCVAPPKGLWKSLLKEKPSVSLMKRGYAIVQIDSFASDVAKLKQAQVRFFSETDDKEKMRYIAEHCHPVSSYGLSTVSNLKEYFQVRVGGKGSKFPFPKGDPDFGEYACKCYHHFDDLDLVDELLDKRPDCSPKVERAGKDDTYVESNLFPSGSSSPLGEYFPTSDKYNSMWTTNHPAHVDSGILSIIPVSDIPGLEFEDQKIEGWIAVEELVQANEPKGYENYAVIMIGEALAIATKNKLKAGMHRVRRIPQNTGPRYSTVFKMRSRPAVTGPRYQQDYVVYEMQEKALKESAGDEK